MKKLKNKLSLILVICFLCIFKNSMVLASDNSNVKYLKEKTTTDINKIWTVKFNGKVDVTSINNGVCVRDLSVNSLVDVQLQRGDSDTSFQITPPKSGYVKGHKYEIAINKNIKSKKNINLKRDVLMNFYVKQDGIYDADINVKVGEKPLTMFKKVTVIKSNLSDAKKFKIEGSESLFNIGDSCVSFTSENKLKVYFYGDDGNKVLGEALINVDEDNESNVEIQVLK